MKIETALNDMQAARDAILVRLLSRGMSTLRPGEILQGKILSLSPQKAVIQLPSGKVTVENPSGIKSEERVWVRLVRRHPVPQLEIFRRQPITSSMSPSKSHAPVTQYNPEQTPPGFRLNQDIPTWKGVIKRVIAGRQTLRPEILYRGQVTESVKGKTIIRLEQGETLKLDEAPTLAPGQKVLLRLTGKAGATPAFIKLMATEGKTEASQPLLKQGQELISRMVQKLPSGKMLIEIQGQQFEANAPRGISSGDHMLLRVSGIQPQPSFEVLDRIPNVKTRAVNLLRNLLINRTPVGTDMMNLYQALNSVMSSGITAAETGLDPDFNLLSSWLRPVLDGSKPPDPGLVKKTILDGGRGQLNIAMQTAADHGLGSLRLIARLRDEAHRSAQSLRRHRGDKEGFARPACRDPRHFGNACRTHLHGPASLTLG